MKKAPQKSSNKTRLEELYNTQLRHKLQKDLGLDNIMQVPKIEKIVLNVGLGREAVADSKVLQKATEILALIAGQQPVRTLARKSIAGFKLRAGMPLGVMVTLRKQRAYEFLDGLINLALPKVRDFQGVPTKLDGRGNYTLGIKEWTIFPEVEYEVTDKIYGLSISIQTTARNDQEGFALLKEFGMPFKK